MTSLIDDAVDDEAVGGDDLGDVDEFGLADEDNYNQSTTDYRSVLPATRRAIIVERTQGVQYKIIALRYGVSESTVKTIWRRFIESTSDVRRLGDENPDIFRSRVRTKAANAIEAGLDCSRDPYRQGSLGVAVMKGIGEFKSDEGNVKVNVLVNNVPPDWRDRYVTTGGKVGDS